MTLQVLKSLIDAPGSNFVESVKAHIAALTAHTRTQGLPAPTAHPLVEQAIKRVQHGKGKADAFEEDYVVVDDTPPPPTVVQQRAAAFHSLYVAEQAARCKILPDTKCRQFDLKVSDATNVRPENRRAEHLDTLSEAKAINQRLDALLRFSADREAELTDLLDDKLAEYKVPAFPEF